MGYLLRCIPLVVWAMLASGCVTLEKIDTNEARITDLERRVNGAVRAAEEARGDATEALQVVEDAGTDAVTANVRASEAVLIAEKAVEIAQNALRKAENALAQARRRASN